MAQEEYAELERTANIPLVPARVAEENRELYRIFCGQGEFSAEVSGKLRHEISSPFAVPTVGDWVLARLRPDDERATIHFVLHRQGRFSRKMAGRKTEGQIMAANVDVVFLVSSLNSEFNLRRLEWYLSLAWDSGAEPVILLNKTDLCEDKDAPSLRRDTEDAAMGVRVILTSCERGVGLAELRAILQPDVTAAFLGSSGVGKSSLINALLGMQQLETQAVRASNDRGRHTTMRRRLLLPSGGVAIDTPGMRELQLWGASDGNDRTLADIESWPPAVVCGIAATAPNLAAPHAPPCRPIRSMLDAQRLESFHKLEKEERFLESEAGCCCSFSAPLGASEVIVSDLFRAIGTGRAEFAKPLYVKSCIGGRIPLSARFSTIPITYVPYRIA